MVWLGGVDPMGSLQCVHGGEQPGVWSPCLASSAATCLLSAFPPRFRAALSASRCFPQLSRALTWCWEPALCRPPISTVQSSHTPGQALTRRSGSLQCLAVSRGEGWRMLGRKGQGQAARVAVDTSSLGGVCGTHPPGLPPIPPPWAFLPQLQGCLKLAWAPALRQSHHDGRRWECFHVDQTLFYVATFPS